jgi:D-xylose transport system substrate-binding protein
MSESVQQGDMTFTRKRLLAGAGAGALGLAASGSLTRSALASRTRASSGKKIGFAMATFAVVRYTYFDYPIFQKEIQKLGYSPIVNQADDNPAEQVTNVQNLLTNGIDVLVIEPVDSQAAVGIVDNVVKQGIPVVVYNTPIPTNKVKAFVARDNVAMGKLIANSALKATGLKGNWGIIGGDPANGVASGTVQGFHEVIDPYIKKGTMNLVASYGEPAFDVNMAHTQAQELLTKVHDNLQGILGMWDDGEIGALAAVQARGLGGKVYMCGQDASEAACRGMVEGVFNMSGFTRFDQMATTGAQLAVELAKGGTITSKQTFDMGGGPVPYFPIPIYPVTRANVVQQMKLYPGYDDPRHILFGVPKDKWPAGAASLPGVA